MVAVSGLQQHIPTMVVERLQPIMTLMVIASDPAATGNAPQKPYFCIDEANYLKNLELS
jgi:hypothetical protein